MKAFSNSMGSSRSIGERMNALTEEVDTVVLIVDENKNIAVVHSPKNPGGTRTRPTHKISCMVGIGPKATCVVLSEDQAVLECNIKTPALNVLKACTSKADVKALPTPGNTTAVTFKGSAAFMFQPPG